MPQQDETSSSSRRQSWSVRLSAPHARVVERGCTITHGGVASWFVERAFLDYAASQGALRLTHNLAPLVIDETPETTLANIVTVQDALTTRLERSITRNGSSLYARQESIQWLSQYLVAGMAPNPVVIPQTPPLAPLPTPLNLRMLPLHLSLLTQIAGEGSTADVVGHAIDAAAANLGLQDDTASAVDDTGLPLKMLRYPHPELLATTKAVEDTLLALLLAYRSLGTVSANATWRESSFRLMDVVPRVKLRQLYARDHEG